MAYRITRVRSKIGFERALALNKLLFGSLYHEGPELGNAIWLATDSTGEAVGFASVRPTTLLPEAAFLSRAGVLSGHRRNGLHRRLIDARMQYALRCTQEDEHGEPEPVFDYVWTFTADWNLGSANNILRQGFLLFDPHWAAPDALYFKKELP